MGCCSFASSQTAAAAAARVALFGAERGCPARPCLAPPLLPFNAPESRLGTNATRHAATTALLASPRSTSRPDTAAHELRSRRPDALPGASIAARRRARAQVRAGGCRLRGPPESSGPAPGEAPRSGNGPNPGGGPGTLAPLQGAAPAPWARPRQCRAVGSACARSICLRESVPPRPTGLAGRKRRLPGCSESGCGPGIRNASPRTSASRLSSAGLTPRRRVGPVGGFASEATPSPAAQRPPRPT